MNKQKLAVKNYLMKAYHVEQRVNSKLDQIASLNNLATRANSNISDMPGSPNRNIHKMENVIVKIIDLQAEIQNEVNQLLNLKKEIMGYISQVTDPECQVILEERYLCYSKWEDIAATLNCSMRQVFRIHDAALDKIQIPESWQ